MSDEELQQTLLRTWNDLTGDGSWSTDRAEGNAIFCPQVAVALDYQRFGIAGKLINAVLDYAREQHQRDESYLSGNIDYAAAYSRCHEYGSSNMNFEDYLKMLFIKDAGIQMSQDKLSEISVIGANLMHADQTIHLHLSRGAKIERIIYDGCPDDFYAGGNIVIMGYTHLL